MLFRSVNGVTCTRFTATPDTDEFEQTFTACVNEDYPFAPEVEFSQSGELVLSLTLTKSNRP